MGLKMRLWEGGISIYTISYYFLKSLMKGFLKINIIPYILN